MRLERIDKSYIINFLVVEDEPQDIKVLALLLNLLFSMIAVYQAENKMLLVGTFLVINVWSISMIVRTLGKKLTNWNEKYLYHGSYVWVLSLNLIIITYLLANKQNSLKYDNMLISVVLSYIVIFVITFAIYLLKIRKNAYEGYKNFITEETLIYTAIIAANGKGLQGWEENLIWFIITYLSAMIFVSKSAYNLLRAYCFSLVDEEDFKEGVKEHIRKISKENATFNRYGTKKHKKF